MDILIMDILIKNTHRCLQTKKTKFESKKLALIRADEIIKESNLPFRVYHCVYCNKYHLSKMSAEKHNKIAKVVKKRKERRFNQEVEYWEDKLGYNLDN